VNDSKCESEPETVDLVVVDGSLVISSADVTLDTEAGLV